MTWFNVYHSYLCVREAFWPERLSGIEEEIYTQEIIILGFLI